VTCARHYGPKSIHSLGVGSCAAPAKKTGIGLVDAGIQRKAKYAISVRLPDLNNRVQNRPISFFQHTAREHNVLTLGLFSLEIG
jgi:hypothetical protein